MNDLIGKKFNHLTVIERGEDYISPKGHRAKRLICVCDCQLDLPKNERKYKLISQTCLINGRIKSCGCNKYNKKPLFIDWTNHRFGKWTVEKQVERPNGKQLGTYWLCKCDCGNEKIFVSAEIKRERSLSCGECSRNTYNITGEYGIGFTTKGEEFYFDLDDYDLIKDFTWCINKSGYVISWNKCTQKIIYMHRLIYGLDSDDKYVVDHIYHINHDNRKEELRICTRAENTRNCKLSKNNTSGVTGVIWNSNVGKWHSQIMVNYKTIGLSYFENFDDAVRCRKDAEEKYFGIFKCKDIKEDV